MTTRAEFPFAFPFRIRYSEIDGQSIVFNAHYLTFFDTTITEFMRWLGYDYAGEVKRTGLDFHTVKTLVEYKAPIHFDEEIEVAIRAARIGRSSLAFALAIFGKAAAGDLRATGEVVWVFTDQRTRETVPVPDRLRALIAEKSGA
jgi:acyl-CoA thioester hydrolase